MEHFDKKLTQHILNTVLDNTEPIYDIIYPLESKVKELESIIKNYKLRVNLLETNEKQLVTKINEMIDEIDFLNKINPKLSAVSRAASRRKSRKSKKLKKLKLKKSKNH